MMMVSLQALFIYAGGFYSNMGNYKSFGDSKFIPNLPKVSLSVVFIKKKIFIASNYITVCNYQ